MERERVISLLSGLRKFVLRAAVVVAVSSVLCFLFFKDILFLLIKAAGISVYYFTLPEALFSSIELSIYAGLFFSFPLNIFLLWYEFRDRVGLKAFESGLLISFSVVLFFAGGLFCYSVVLKSGIKFLLCFEGDVLKAMISVEKFIGFASAMIFAFAFVFEVPVILLGLNKKGLVKSITLRKKRRYAILFIAVASALITPTPDAYNMLFLAVPAYILYETGILLMMINERKDGRAG